MVHGKAEEGWKMKRLFVKDLKPGDMVESSFLVVRKDKGISRSGSPYLILRLKDRTGEVDGRVWNEAESLATRFERDDVIEVKAQSVPYQGGIQLNIVDIRRLAEDEFSVADYLPSARLSPERMMKELETIIDEIKDRHIRRLLKDLFDDADVRQRFMVAPAARSYHHPYVGGLIEHVLSLCRLAGFVASHYSRINMDLLVAGAILHDIGKIYEISCTGSFEYTDEGRLLGHITMGVELVDSKIKAIEDFPQELAMLIKHMILSHHGHLEFGSPKRPKTLEAMVLFYLDDMDAKVNAIESLMEKKEGRGNWSEYQRLFERYIYKARYVSDVEPEQQAGRQQESVVEELSLWKKPEG